MLEIDVPGFGLVQLEHLVSDFTGTSSIPRQKSYSGISKSMLNTA